MEQQLKAIWEVGYVAIHNQYLPSFLDALAQEISELDLKYADDPPRFSGDCGSTHKPALTQLYKDVRISADYFGMKWVPDSWTAVKTLPHSEAQAPFQYVTGAQAEHE